MARTIRIRWFDFTADDSQYLRERGVDLGAAPVSELVEIARSPELWHMESLRARLDCEGIASTIVNENCNRMGPPFSSSAGGARLLVWSGFEQDARQIADLVAAGAFALGPEDDVV